MIGFSYPQRFRLKDAAQLQRVRNYGSKRIVGGWKMYSMTNNLSYSRLAIIVGKRYVKLAVQRNLLRRIIKERFRQRMGFGKGLDYLLILIKPYGCLDGRTLNAELDALLESSACSPLA